MVSPEFSQQVLASASANPGDVIDQADPNLYASGQGEYWGICMIPTLTSNCIDIFININIIIISSFYHTSFNLTTVAVCVPLKLNVSRFTGWAPLPICEASSPYMHGRSLFCLSYASLLGQLRCRLAHWVDSKHTPSTKGIFFGLFRCFSLLFCCKSFKQCFFHPAVRIWIYKYLTVIFLSPELWYWLSIDAPECLRTISFIRRATTEQIRQMDKWTTTNTINLHDHHYQHRP